MSSFSGFTSVLFHFCLYTFIEAAAVRSIVLRYAGSPTATRVFFFFLFVVLLEMMSLSSSIFCIIAVFSLYGEYVVRFSLPDGVFYLVTTGCIFYISLCENSIKNK